MKMSLHLFIASKAKQSGGSPRRLSPLTMTTHGNIVRKLFSFLLILLMFAEPALADVTQFSCPVQTGNTMGDTGGIIVINNNGGTSTDCSTVPGVFSRVTCIFKTEVGLVMSQVYCNFQQFLLGPVSDALILAVSIYGVLLLAGMVQVRKDSAIFLFKIALIYGFATSAQLGIGYAYAFFMGGAETGANLAICAISPATSPTVCHSTGTLTPTPSPDITTINALNGMTGGSLTGGTANALPSTLSPYCAQLMVVALIFMGFLLPVVPATVLGMTMQYLQLYARALLGYFVAFTLICFLFVFSPIFLGFGLFRATYGLFESWLKYLTVLAIQVILTFAFFAMIGAVIAPLTAFVPEMLGLIREYDDTWQQNSFTLPMHPCSFCEYKITQGSGSSITSPATIACTGTPYTATANTPYLQSVASNADGTPVMPKNSFPGTNQNVIPLWTLLANTGNAGGQALLLFLMENFFGLWLVLGVMMELFGHVEDIAKNIGGLPFGVGITGDGLAGTTGSVNMHYPGFDTVDKYTKAVQNVISTRPWNSRP